jgi:Rrf2 family transcriptional regulator, iron-sulfur cluster assembly transcription factor
MPVLQLPAKVRVAVVALVVLASRDDCCGRPVSLAEIACLRQLSQTYLEQLFCRLRRAGLVASARGPGGGYRLARPPAQVLVAEIVDAMDEPDAKAEAEADPCERTHALWAAMNRHLRQFLQQVTLDDVVRHRLLVLSAENEPDA